MKHLLLTTIAAVVLVGCGESQQSAPPAEAKPVEPVAEAATPEPPTAKAPDISIHSAAYDENIEAVKQHLAAGTDVNAKDKRGLTPLHWASLIGHKEAVELLISKGADVNAKIDDGRTPLDFAIKRKPEIADLLRKHGGKNGTIHSAAGGGDIEAVKDFLAAGTDVNAKQKNGLAPLHHAAEEGHKEIVELLIAQGADVTAKNKYGSTPLHRAAVGGSREVVETLINKGADVNAKNEDGRTALSYVKTKELAELLITKGADVNATDGGGYTKLDYAKLGDRTELANLLRKHGGKTRRELKAPTAKAIDILIFKAAFEGNVEAVKQRLAAGTDVNAKNNDGSTPLHIAARHGVKEVAELLIDKGADVNVKNAFGRTPLDYSEEVKDWYSPKDKAAKKEIAELLHKHGGKTGKELRGR